MLVNKNFLICLTGLPASGKTTFANKLKEILEKKFTKLTVTIIDPDKIRQTMAPDEFNYTLEPIVRERNLTDINKELSKGNIVISDDLNYYSSMRHDLKNLAENFKINFLIIHISTPFKTCLTWNEMRGEPIPNIIIDKIRKKFDDFGKYKWDYPLLSYDPSQIRDTDKGFEGLVSELIKRLTSPQTISKEEKELEKSSRWDNQNLDRITRIYVGKLLRNPKLIPFKKKIIKTRKLYMKLYKNKALTEFEIVTTFKDYLKKSLTIKNSEELS
jgi:tRNA uridine 5-carbamoylmethylation protein Kti12